MSNFADRVLTGLGPALTERAGPLLAPLVDGLTAPLAVTDDALAPTDRGWARVFDLDESTEPALIGRATGTLVPGGLTLAQQRDYVRQRPAWRRGTPGSIRAAVAAVLTGPRQVTLVERDGSPWRLTVRVYAGQYPGGNLEQLRRVIATQKPVGILVEARIDQGGSYAHMAAVHGPTYAAAAADFGTYQAAIAHEPEEGTTP